MGEGRDAVPSALRAISGVRRNWAAFPHQGRSSCKVGIDFGNIEHVRSRFTGFSRIWHHADCLELDADVIFPRFSDVFYGLDSGEYAIGSQAVSAMSPV